MSTHLDPATPEPIPGNCVDCNAPIPNADNLVCKACSAIHNQPINLLGSAALAALVEIRCGLRPLLTDIIGKTEFKLGDTIIFALESLDELEEQLDEAYKAYEQQKATGGQQ